MQSWGLLKKKPDMGVSAHAHVPIHTQKSLQALQDLIDRMEKFVRQGNNRV